MRIVVSEDNRARSLIPEDTCMIIEISGPDQRYGGRTFTRIETNEVLFLKVGDDEYQIDLSAKEPMIKRSKNVNDTPGTRSS